MCFTINVNIVREEMEKRFNAVFPEPRRYEPNYYLNAFNQPEVPVISSENPGSIRLYRWGLVPSWVKDRKNAEEIRTKTFNARAESIDQKPSFKYPVRKKRCLVISNGFYEWQSRTDGKIPFYIYLKDHRIFAFAGISDTWRDPETGADEHTFSIITTRANSLLERIHNLKKRMPVILQPEDEKKWLDPGQPMDKVLALLQPHPAEDMHAHSISRLITARNVDRNVPALIEPYAYPEAPLLE